MAKADIRAGRAFVELYVENSAFVKGLNAASAKLKAFGSSTMAVGGVVSGIGASILAPLGAAVNSFMSVGDQLDKMSGRTGVSAQALAELGYAARQSGSSAEDVEAGLRKLSKVLIDAERGGKTSQRTLSDLGMTLEDLKGLSPDQQFEKLAGAISQVEDPMRRAALAQEVFGKSGTKLLPLMAAGAEGIAALREQARGLGISTSDEDVKNAVVLGDTIADVKESVMAAVFQIGAALAPSLIAIATTIRTVVAAGTRWITQNRGLFVTIAAIGAAIFGAGAALTALGGTIFVVGTALGAIATVITAVVSPVGLAVVGVVALVAALGLGVYAWAKWTTSGQNAVRGVMSFFGPLLQIARDTIGGVVDALMAGDLELAGKIAVTGLRLAFAQGMAQISALIGGTFGDAIATITSQILAGDFQAAWGTAVAGMAALWDAFTSGVVNTFTDAAKQVTEVWRQTVSEISDFILDTSAKGGVFGAAMSKVLGVDMKAEQERADRLNQQLGLAPQNITDEAKRSAREQITGTADAITGFLDDMNQVAADQAAASSKRFADSVSGATEGLLGDASGLARELAELRARAAAARAANQFTGGGDGEAGPTSDTAEKASAFVTFSAAALVGQGIGGGVQERMARSLDSLLTETKRLATETSKNLTETRKLLTAS